MSASSLKAVSSTVTASNKFESSTISFPSVSVPRVLTVAGSDSGSGAGIQADLKTCAARGVFCTVAITALTAQNTEGVQAVHVVPAEFLEKQLDSVLSDIGTDVVKTGMLPNAESVAALCRVLKRYPVKALVVDPVLVATSGHKLADSTILSALRNDLFPMAEIVTPNLLEASSILDIDPSSIQTVQDMKDVAKKIHSFGSRYVLVKGGHLPGCDSSTDVLYNGEEFFEFSAPRISTRNTHGTGCTLASAIASEIAKGNTVEAAVKVAKGYLTETLTESKSLAIGGGKQGPLNHIPSLTDWDSHGSPRGRFQATDLRLYAVTDSRMNATWSRSMVDAIRDAILGGATFLQIREKDIETGDFVKVAAEAVKIAREANVPLVVNDRIDVALAVDADGIHIGQSDMPAAMARSILGSDKIIGVSCKTPAHAQAAFEAGADYIGSGGVYPTSTKENNTTIGLSGLATVCQSSQLPVVAIGGIKGHRIHEVLQCGGGPNLAGVAVVSAIFDQSDVREATRKLREQVDALECS